jgi:hypothetical protein
MGIFPTAFQLIAGQIGSGARNVPGANVGRYTDRWSERDCETLGDFGDPGFAFCEDVLGVAITSPVGRLPSLE